MTTSKQVEPCNVCGCVMPGLCLDDRCEKCPDCQWTSRVLHGDTLRVLPTLPDASVDVVLTDPPYSSGGAFSGDRKSSTASKYVQTGQVVQYEEFLGDTRDQRGYQLWTSIWSAEALRVSREGAHLLCFTDWRQLPATVDALQAGGWLYRGIVVWDKTGAARPSKGGFSSRCEYVVWATNGPLDRGPDRPALQGVIVAPTRDPDKIHMAQKPIGLLRELLRICPPGGTVLDPFAGSGSTGVAAVESGLDFIGVELSEHWHQVASERIAAASPSLMAGTEPNAHPASLPLDGEAA